MLQQKKNFVKLGKKFPFSSQLISGGELPTDFHVQNQWNYYSLIVQEIYKPIVDLSFFYKGSIIHLINYSPNPGHHSAGMRDGRTEGKFLDAKMKDEALGFRISPKSNRESE